MIKKIVSPQNKKIWNQTQQQKYQRNKHLGILPLKVLWIFLKMDKGGT